MNLIELVLTLAIVGFIVWLLVTYVPMPAPFKNVIIAIIVLFLILWLVRAFLPGLGQIRI